MITAEWSWEGLLAKCKNLQQKYGPDIEIPTAYDPDVLQLFDDCEVQVNVFRFVMYILWLAEQPEAFEKHLRVKLSRPDLWTKCVFEVCRL